MATYGFGSHPDFFQHNQFGGHLGFGETPGSVAPTQPKAGAPAPTGSKPSTGSTGGLNTNQKNALTVIDGILSQYGLSSLSNVVLNYVKQGYNSDAINVLIQQTPEWKQRFAGNEIRMKNGLAPLDPSTYLATEASYSQAIKAAGLPTGFYDGGSDFAGWIGGDVSPTEVQQRAQDAAQLVDSQDPGVVQALTEQGITKGQLAAYFLDQKRAMPLLQQTFNAIGIGTAAADQNLHLSGADAQKYASMGVTQGQAQQAYQTIGQALPRLTSLASIYHQAYGQQDLENELLGGSGTAALSRQRLENEEQAQFSGKGAAAQTLQDPGYGLAAQTQARF